MTIEKMKEDSDETYSRMNQMETWEKGSETNANDMESNKTQEDQNQHEVAKTYQLTTVIAQHVLLMSAKFSHMVYATTTLKRCVDQSINSRNPARRTHTSWEETSVLNWDQGLEFNVSVLDRTHSRRRTREVIG